MFGMTIGVGLLRHGVYPELNRGRGSSHKSDFLLYADTLWFAGGFFIVQ